MNIFRRVISAVQKAVGAYLPVPGRGGWYPMVGDWYTGAWQKNDERELGDLLCSPIVYACVTLIANDIGKLRSRLVEKDEKIWVEVDNNNPYWFVLRDPNRYQNPIQFRQWWIMSKLRFGNAYALKERDQRGIVRRLYLLDPCKVQPVVTEDGAVYYQLMNDNLAGIGIGEELRMVPASEIIHDRMNCLYHPLVGISPLYAAAVAAGIGIKIQRNVAWFFGNNSNPAGILVAPGNIPQATADEIKARWQDSYGGNNTGKIAVLSGGYQFQPIRQSATDAQLINVLQWSDERICSVFHVPAYKVGVGQTPSYNNVEALEQNYYANCLQSLIEEMEACLDKGLGLDGFTIGVDLDLDGLLRMDSKTQMETLKLGIDAKALTINDVRARLNKPDLDGGDTVYMQQQDFPLDEIRNNTIADPEPVPAALPAPEVVEPEPEEDAEEVARNLIEHIRKGLIDA